LIGAPFDNNALLQTLQPAVRARFQPRFRRVELRRGEVMYNPGEPIDWVYFPLTGLVAILSETLAGESVESGMIGCDGAVAIVEACGSRQAFSRAVVQVPGEALRISAAACREMFEHSSDLRISVFRYMELLLTEARQSAVCNALHSVESRLSRSILEALERSCLERILPLTQESLAQMLGAQRTTVAVCLSALQRAGLVKSGRGAIEVLDRAGLERRACSCRKSLQYVRREVQSSEVELRTAASR
jgi:CRP-like cAMP-binding protein